MRALLALLLLCVTQAFGTTYYISSSSGSDSANNGTSPASPWKTGPKASIGPYSPGDFILFKCGDTFAGSDARIVTPSNSNGTLGAPITFGHYPTTCPVLPLLTGAGSVGVSITRNYITIDGLDIRSATTLISLSNRIGTRIVNSVLKNGSLRGVYGTGVGATTFDHNTYVLEAGHTMTSDVFHVEVTGFPVITMTNNSCDVSVQSGSGQSTICFTSFGGDATMQYNIARGAQQGYAIKPIDGTGCTGPAVTHGLIADNYSDGASSAGGRDGENIELQGCSGQPQTGVTVTRNVIVCKAAPNGSTDAIGLFQSSNAKITGNLLIGPCPTASSTPRVIHASSGSTGNQYIGNTIVSATTASGSQGIDLDSAGSDLIKNNLFKRLTYGIRNNSSGSVTEDYNIYDSDVTTPRFQTPGTISQGGHSLTGTAPGFAVGSGIDPNNYKLTAGAAALTSAISLGSPYDVILASNATAFPFGTYTQTTGTWIGGAFGLAGGVGPPPPPIINPVKISGSAIVGGTVSIK